MFLIGDGVTSTLDDVINYRNDAVFGSLLNLSRVTLQDEIHRNRYCTRIAHKPFYTPRCNVYTMSRRLTARTFVSMRF